MEMGRGQGMKPYRVKPDRRVNLREHDPRDTGDFKSEEEAEDRAEQLKQKLEALQERLYAERSRAVLVVLQGMDTSGKDGTVRHLMRSVNPLGCIVTSFKAPTPVEKAHDFLWRHAACRPWGHVIFNRLIEIIGPRVHGLIADRRSAPPGADPGVRKYARDHGTRILKFFLHYPKRSRRSVCWRA